MKKKVLAVVVAVCGMLSVAGCSVSVGDKATVTDEKAVSGTGDHLLTYGDHAEMVTVEREYRSNEPYYIVYDLSDGRRVAFGNGIVRIITNPGENSTENCYTSGSIEKVK